MGLPRAAVRAGSPDAAGGGVMMTAAELRAAQDRYDAAIAELRAARNALAEAERQLTAATDGLSRLDARKVPA